MISYLVFFLVIASFYALLSLALNLHWGAGGLMNVGITGFFGLGGYASALLTGPHHAASSGGADSIGGLELPLAVGWISGTVLAGLVALAIGGPVLRLRDDFLAIVTFGFATVVYLFALNLDAFTRGPEGLYGLPKPFGSLGLSNLATNSLTLALMIALVGGVYVAFEAMIRSPWGRVLRAIRADEAATQSFGKHAFRFRLEAFVVGAAVMGLAGAAYASFLGFFSPQDLLPVLTFQVYAMLIVGGAGNNRGAIAGGVLVWALWSGSGAGIAALLPASLQTQSGAIRVIVIGGLLALVLLFRPQGLLPEARIVSRQARLDDLD